YGGATGWSLATCVAKSNGSASNLKVHCPSGLGRLVGVQINGAPATSGIAGSVIDLQAVASDSAGTATVWCTGLNALGIGGPPSGKYTPVAGLGLKLPIWSLSGG